MLRVVTLSTLFPDRSRPNFGVFVERQTLGLAAAPDTDVRVIAPVGVAPWPLRHAGHRALAELPRDEVWKGVAVHRPCFAAVPLTGGWFHPALLTRAVMPYLDRVRGSFDVIDASFFFPDGPAAVALGRRYGVPVSIKARGADIHHWGRVRRHQVLAAGCGAQGLLAVSDAMRSDMAAIGLPAERVRVHRTGIDRARFHPHGRTAGGDGTPTVLSLGALIPRKGHGIVMEAVASLPGVRLVIAGEGPEHAKLIAQAQRLGVADRVRLLGAVPHADLPALLRSVDVMALASASEGLANAWVEALACGTPIVITAAGGAAEVVTDCHAGRIAERTAPAFAAAIADLLAAAPPAAAVARAADPFSWQRNTDELRAHLAALVSGYRAA